MQTAAEETEPVSRVSFTFIIFYISLSLVRRPLPSSSTRAKRVSARARNREKNFRQYCQPKRIRILYTSTLRPYAKFRFARRFCPIDNFTRATTFFAVRGFCFDVRRRLLLLFYRSGDVHWKTIKYAPKTYKHARKQLNISRETIANKLFCHEYPTETVFHFSVKRSPKRILFTKSTSVHTTRPAHLRCHFRVVYTDLYECKREFLCVNSRQIVDNEH